MGSSPPPSLRQLRLKPEHCGPAELFVQWRDALGEVFEVRATPAEIAAFRGEIDVHASARYVASSSRNSRFCGRARSDMGMELVSTGDDPK